VRKRLSLLLRRHSNSWILRAPPRVSPECLDDDVAMIRLLISDKKNQRIRNLIIIYFERMQTKPELLRLKYPEEQVIDLLVQEGDDLIQLHTYHYPSQSKEGRQGVVFYLHGYGTYAGNTAYFFKAFAEEGFDVFCYDQRGFGKSEGERGFIESADQLYHDNWKFIDTVIGKYKLEGLPYFLVGTSFGGLQSFNMAMMREGFFKGVGLIVPYLSSAIPEFN